MGDWYRDYLKSDHWKAKRAEKAKAADYRCERCGEYGKRTRHAIVGVQVHHLSYKNVWDEPLEDLELLCIACHEEEHGIAEADEAHRDEIRRSLSRRIAGRVFLDYQPDDIELEVAAWDELAEAAGL